MWDGRGESSQTRLHFAPLQDQTGLMIYLTADRRCNKSARRLLALAILVWLAPVMASPVAASAMPSGMTHCEHGGTPDHPAPCRDMRARECVAMRGVLADAPRNSPQARTGAMLARLPPAATVAVPRQRAGLFPAAGDAGSPLLHIRFCKLRN